ncbi:hypothetical protein HKX48_002787, partial [Thoreauomyces humboldtii]
MTTHARPGHRRAASFAGPTPFHLDFETIRRAEPVPIPHRNGYVDLVSPGFYSPSIIDSAGSELDMMRLRLDSPGVHQNHHPHHHHHQPCVSVSAPTPSVVRACGEEEEPLDTLRRDLEQLLEANPSTSLLTASDDTDVAFSSSVVPGGLAFAPSWTTHDPVGDASDEDDLFSGPFVTSGPVP